MLKWVLAGGGAGTGVERDQEDGAAHLAREVSGRHHIEVAVVLLEAEDGALFVVLAAVTHEMHDALLLVGDQQAEAL